MTGHPDHPSNFSQAQWHEAALRGHGAWPWVGFVVATLLLMDVVALMWIGLIAPVAAAALLLVQRRSAPSGVVWWHRNIDRADLVGVATLYVAVVALFGVAFQGVDPSASATQSRERDAFCRSRTARGSGG